jgi:transposase-like protein
MLNTTELNLATLSAAFADEDKARELFEKKLWPLGPVCPHCGSMDGAYKLEGKSESNSPVRKGVYKCKACRKQYTVRVGTVMEDSHIPLKKWLMVFHLMASSKKGVSSLQISREIGVTHTSAWFMTHRIREAMRSVDAPPLSGTVEVDETYVGGKPRSGGEPGTPGRGTRKKPVVVLVERDGRAVSHPVPRVTAKELKGAIARNVALPSKIVTDEFVSYRGIGKHYDHGHSVVNHSSGQYVNEDGEHTNTAESFFALIKRGHIGAFHQMSEQHLGRYVTEFEFRWNHRKVTDGERMVEAIKGSTGKRLYYNRPD